MHAWWTGAPTSGPQRILLTEAFSALLRKERERSLETGGRRLAWRQLHSYLEDGGLQLVPVTRSLLARANALLDACHPTVPLRSLDAIHLASFEGCRSGPFVTNDRLLRAAAIKLDMPLAPTAPTA